MADAHHLPPAIQWHEGMLLSPQHFQQLACRHEELLHYHLTATAPFHWGIRHLEIDSSLLRVNGICRVVSLEAIMPDGTVVSHLPDEESLEADLTPYISKVRDRDTALTIHLAVPAKKVGGATVRGGLERFRAVEGDPVPDENTGDSSVAIPRLLPRIELRVEEEGKPLPRRYDAFPLIKVRYKDDKFGQTDFIPPLLSVAADSEIGRLCAAISDLLREKAEILSEKLRADFLNLETRFVIHGLVSGLPRFEAVLGTGCAHPYLLYLTLCTLAGNVAVVAPDQIPPKFSSPYDHNDLRATFEAPRLYIAKVIEEGIFESHEEITFEFDPAERIFGLELRPEWMTEKLTIGVRGKSGATEKEIRAWMENSLIGSASLIDSLRERKILGASRTELGESRELVPSRGMILFTVRVNPRFILPEEPLQIRNLSDPMIPHTPAEIVLYIRRSLRPASEDQS